MSLYPFQKECVQQIERWNGRCLLALEMGLGKSLTALTWAERHPKLRPVIIVCPASLKINWGREIQKWYPKRTFQLLEGRSTDKIPKTDYIILNYDILHNWAKLLLTLRPPIIIFDEVHALKNKAARRTKAGVYLARKVPHIIALSGTPVINRPVEFFNILALLKPDMFDSWWKYVTRYCAPKRKRYGRGRTFLDTSGAANLEELNTKLLRHVMLRKLKSEVQKELPDKTRTVIPLPLTDRKEYVQALQQRMINPLQYFGELKRAAVRAKLPAVIEWIADVIEDNKLVAFCHHHEIVDVLMTKFGKKAVRLTGKENLKQRQKAIDSFQTNPKVKLFVGNMQAAGVGINLTAADHCVFVELGWTPSVHDQAEDRLHRIGQKNTVNVYYLIASDTVEEDVMTLIDKKRTVITQIMDGKVPEDSTILTELLKLYKEKGVVHEK